MNPSITSKVNTEEVEEVSLGQKEACVTLVTDATRKAAGVAINELVERGVLTKTNIEKVRGCGNEIVAAVTALIKEKFAELAENVAGIVKLISGAKKLTLAKADGKRTFAKSKKIFTGWLDPDFENYGTNVPSAPTEETDVAVHEMIKDGDFRKIFGSFGIDLDKLCLTQDQIIQFVEKHRDWLHPDGNATFFLFKVAKGGRSEFFVADVGVDAGRLEADADRLSNDYVWDAGRRHRFVVPQLAPGSRGSVSQP